MLQCNVLYETPFREIFTIVPKFIIFQRNKICVFVGNASLAKKFICIIIDISPNFHSSSNILITGNYSYNFTLTGVARCT